MLKVKFFIIYSNVNFCLFRICQLIWILKMYHIFSCLFSHHEEVSFEDFDKLDLDLYKWIHFEVKEDIIKILKILTF